MLPMYSFVRMANHEGNLKGDILKLLHQQWGVGSGLLNYNFQIR